MRHYKSNVAISLRWEWRTVIQHDILKTVVGRGVSPKYEKSILTRFAAKRYPTTMNLIHSGRRAMVI